MHPPAQTHNRVAGAPGKSLCDSVSPTPYLTLLYGRVEVDGSLAPPGAQVEVLTSGGGAAGCFIVEQPGQFGLMPVFGADATAGPASPGFHPGELLAFRVNGVPAQVDSVTRWQDDKTPHQLVLKTGLNDVYLPLIVK